MKLKSTLFETTVVVLLLSIVIPMSSFGTITPDKVELWYKNPASAWMEALPVGNGRIGAMVFGDPNHEHLQLNDDSMWAGAADWGDSKGTPEDLKLIRKLLKEGKVHTVDKLIVDKFSFKSVLRSHQTLGDLYIDFKEKRKIDNYRRSLDLERAVANTTYACEGYRYSEQVFASAADDVLVIKLSTDNPDGLDFYLRLNRPKDHGHSTVKIDNPNNNEIRMSGMATQFGGKKFSKPFPIDYGVKFETILQIHTPSGTTVAESGALNIKGAREAIIYIVNNTSFYHENYSDKNRSTLNALKERSYQDLFQRHIADYQNLFNRVSFDLDNQDHSQIPTDERIKRLKEGANDPDLSELLFQYGRYLLISSSRPGTNPANLQGLWNNHIEAPWNADYHININLQMNYWPAEVTNLSELHEPFFDLIDRAIKRGKNTAKDQYGIRRGSVIHHTTDLWATPWMRAEQAFWGSWIHGGGWTAQHYFEHFRFSQDIDFLEKRAYPMLKAVAEFYLDWLVWDDKTKSWVSAPETSPENSYYAADGKPAAVSFGSAMGHQIIGEVFDNVLTSAKILGIDDDFIKEVKAKHAKLHPGVLIGPDGRIQEWNEPYDEPEKGHRHMSHLYALHPGNAITQATPEAFEAAKKTIAYRLAHGGAGTGWSRAWMINLNARLFQNKKAEYNIHKLFEKSIAANMFDEHPPFQIDGNFGFTAAVAELLLQSHEGFIRILPTLPPSWKNGHITGLKARGNIEVEIYWKDGKLTKLGLRTPLNQLKKIVYNQKEQTIALESGKTTWLDGNLKPID